MANDQIRFGVGFDLNQADLNNLKSSLKDLQQLTASAFTAANPGKTFTDVKADLISIKSVASTVEEALTAAFNPKLGTINVTTFNNELKKTHTGVSQIYETFSKAGSQGQIAFQKLATTVLTTNTELKQTQTIIDKMATTLGNTVKWNIASGAVNKLTGSIQEAYGYVKSLDGSLNDIMIVTQKSAEEMDKFAEKANNAAKSLGVTTTDYTKSALTFYQQGLSDEEVEARTDLTNKVANASGLSADDAAEYVTAVLNGYKVGSEEAEAAMDVLANVGAHTASSLSELSEAMSKVSSTASTMGVSEEQLAASLATVIQTTRQDASSVGTAFKTIYMRISDIAAGTEDAEVSLGNYTSQMAEMGVNVLDETGNLRDLGEVMEEIGNGWEDMSREQQISLARTMAGTRQANNLLALFDNWDDYSDALGYATDATGTLQQQQDTYMESTEAHLNKLKASEEDLFDSLLDPDTINGFSDALSGVTDFMANWVDAIGGGSKALLALGSIGLSVFSDQIGKGLGTMINNTMKAKENVKEIATQMALIPEFKSLGNDNINQLAQMKEEILSYGSLVTDEQMQEANGYIKEKAALLEKQQVLEDTQTAATGFLSKVSDVNGDIFSDIFKIENIDEFNDKCADTEVALEQALEAASIGEDDFKELANSVKTAQTALKAKANAAKDDAEAEKTASEAAETLKAKFDGQKDSLADMKSLLDENSTEYKNLENAIKGMNDALASGEGYDTAFKKFTNAYNQAQAKIQQGAANARQAMDNTSNGAAQSVGKELDSLQARWNAFKNSLNTQEFVKGLSKTLGGVGQLTSALMTLSNIKDTLENDDLSTFDKTLQIIQQATTGITMLATGFGSLTTGIQGIIKGAPGIATFFTTLVTGEAAGTAGGITLQAALWEITLIAAAVAAAIALIVGISVALVNAWNADADAAKEAAEQVETLTERYDELNTAAEELKDTISEYDDAVTALDELTKGTDEYKEALDEANEKARDLIETYKLFDDYTIDENGLIQIDQAVLDAAQAKANKSANEAGQQMYGAEIISNQAAIKSKSTNLGRNIGAVVGTGYYSEYGETTRNFTNAELQEAARVIQEVTKDVDLEGDALKEALLNYDGLSDSIKTNIDAIVNNKDQLDSLANSMSDAEEANEYYAKQILGLTVEDKYGDQISEMSGGDASREAQITAAATAAALKAQEGSDSSMAQEIAAIDVSKASSNNATNKILSEAGWTEQIQNDESLARLYAEKVLGYDNVDDFTYKGGINKGTLKDETGNEVVDEVSDDVMRHALARQAQIDQITEKYASQLESDTGGFMDSLDTMIEKTDEFGKQFGADFTSNILDNIANNGDGTLDLSSLFTELDPNEVAQLMGMSGEDLATALGLTQDQLTALGFDSADAFGTAFQDALGDYDASAWRDNLISAIRSAKSDVESLISGLQSGDIDSSNIADNEEYQDLLQNLDKVKEADSDLTAAADLLGETWLVGTQEYQEALEQVQDALYAIDLGDLIDDAEEAKDKVEEFISEDDEGITIDVDADPEAFEDAMDDLMNKEYQIDVAIHTEAEQEFDSVSNALNDIQEKAGLIGDNFIVAASDVRELNNTFPGILEGMTTLADGTVQLNSEVVQSAMGMAESEAQADAQATIDKLNNQATLLRAKQKSYQNMANAALVLAQGETATDEEAAAARATISSELANLQEYNSQEASQSETNNAVEVADSSNVNAQAVASNWQSAFQSMADSSYDAASIAIANMNAVESGGTATKGTVSVNYHGSTGQSTEASIINATQDALDSAGTSDSSSVWAGLAQKYASLADSAGSAANDIEGMIAQIGATSSTVDNALGGVSKGLGSDNKSDDSSSGDSDSEDEPDTMDPFEDDDVDRYHQIDTALEQINTELDRLQKKEDKLTGQALIDNLNEQLDVLNKQVDAYHQKIELAYQERDELKNTLAAQGVEFNGTDGTISNYVAALEAKKQYINDLITVYNNLSASEQEAFKSVIEKAEDDYDKLKEDMENYDTLISDTIPGLEDDIEDALYKEIEIQIEKFDMEVEIRLDMQEAEQDWNEFKRKIIDGFDDDDLTGKAQESAANVSSYFRTKDSNGNIVSNTGVIQTNTNKVNTIMDEITKMQNGDHSDIYSAYDENTGTWVDDISSAEDDLKETYTELMGELEDLEDEQEAVHDAFLDSIDAVNDAFDNQKETFEFVGEQIDHDIKMMQLLYGDDAYGKMDEYYQKQVANTESELAAEQKAVSYWKDKMDKERALVEQGLGDKEALEKYEENWEDAVGNVNDLLEQWAEQVTEKYENTIDELIDNLNKKVSNGLGLDYLDEELSLLNDNADNYLDTINSAYAVQNLQNKWQDAINNTDSIAAQRQLNELMQEQMDMLEKKGELTQYDIDRAEKEYEIALKQIALQEAQQNKSTMRLKRDANGNYSYQYVSDEDSIREAQQELAEAQNDLYNFDKEAYTNNLNEMYSVYSEFQEKMAQVYKDYANDAEALEEHKALLIEEYGEKINYLTEQNANIRTNLEDSAFTNLASLYGTDVSNFTDMTSVEKDLILNDLVPQWSSGVQDMITTFSGEDGFKGTCLDTFDALDQASIDYQSDMDDIEEKNREASEEAEEESEELLRESEELIEEADQEYERIGLVVDQVNELIGTYQSAKQAAIDATKAAYDFVSAQNAANAAAASGSNSDSSTTSDTTNTNTTTDTSKTQTTTSSTSGTTASDDIVKGIATAIWCEGNNGWGNDPGRKQKLIAKFNESTRNAVQSYINAHANNGDLYSYWVNTLHRNASAYHYDKFKLGGLATATGPAWLDGTPSSPEMVLNAGDTQNILSALSVLDSIVSSLGSSALNNIADKLSNIGFNGGLSGSSDTLEQTVYITATFEGQTEADQIQTALDNLVNIASQRAYRSNK